MFLNLELSEFFRNPILREIFSKIQGWRSRKLNSNFWAFKFWTQFPGSPFLDFWTSKSRDRDFWWDGIYQQFATSDYQCICWSEIFACVEIWEFEFFLWLVLEGVLPAAIFRRTDYFSLFYRKSFIEKVILFLKILFISLFFTYIS